MCAILTYARADAAQEFFEEMLYKTHSRGPDMSRTLKVSEGWMGFNRLSIMGITESGMQPFVYTEKTVLDASTLSEGKEGWRVPQDAKIFLSILIKKFKKLMRQDLN